MLLEGVITSERFKTYPREWTFIFRHAEQPRRRLMHHARPMLRYLLVLFNRGKIVVLLR